MPNKVGQHWGHWSFPPECISNADFKKPFLLETDASIEGLGAVLSQKQDDSRYHPIAYTSRGLKGGEFKYHSSKLEFLALKWAVTDQFREYLQYQPFLVRTDNNPLTYVMMTPNLDAVRHRWVAAMAVPRELLGASFQSVNRTKCPPWSRGWTRI